MATLSDYRDRIRTAVAEPTNGRFFNDSEINEWINEALLTIANDLQMFKRSETFLGSAYVGTPTTSEIYKYELPDDFMRIDKNQGIKINGLRVKGATQRQIDEQQEVQLANAANDQVLYSEDYYTEIYTNLTFVYTVDYIDLDEIDAGRNGRLCWFLPNREDDDSIKLYYIASHPVLSSDSDIVYVDKQYENLIVNYGAYKAAQKMMIAGFVSENDVATYRNGYDEVWLKAKKFYTDIKKQNDQKPRIMTGKQVYGLYNSVGRRRKRNKYYEDY